MDQHPAMVMKQHLMDVHGTIDFINLMGSIWVL